MVSYCFEKPVSPHLAAIYENKKIEPQKIKEDIIIVASSGLGTINSTVLTTAFIDKLKLS